ncbi:MAG TPA: AEC family transporter [Armatimonadota bacterium]|jgi:hypothetical protein
MHLAAQVLAPVLFILALGFLLERTRPIEPRTLSQVSIYVLTPCLVFYTVATTRITTQEFLKIGAFLVALTACLWVITKAVARARGYSVSRESVLMLCTLFMNAGNYGIPVALYAFGEGGVDRAVVWVLLQNVLFTSLAVFYAARDTLGSRGAFNTVFKMPQVYTALAAWAFRLLDVPVPPGMLEPIRALGLAMIPIAQLLLGVQLSQTVSTITSDTRRIGLACLLRLVVSPLLAFPLAYVLGIHGLTRQVVILLSGMPTAVNTSILAIEFNAEPRYVCAVVFISTMLSFLTLMVLLTLVK